MYNKEVHLTPYAITSGAKKGKRKGSGDADLGEDGEETVVSEETDQEDIMADGMIKVSGQGKPGCLVSSQSSLPRSSGCLVSSQSCLPRSFGCLVS